MHLIDICQVNLEPAEPLWKRVPTRGDDGRPLSDFMMIIPGLRDRPKCGLERRLADIHGVLSCYGSTVVFAEVILRLNLLWVSVKPLPGICLELPALLQQRIPEALLVAHKYPA
jgi:hypothetical protein